VQVPATPLSAADPDKPVEAEVVVIVDQWSSRSLLRHMRPGSRPTLDFDVLLPWLSGGRPAVGIFACPPIPALTNLRVIVRQHGWLVYDLPQERGAQVSELEALARRHAADHDVVMLTEHPVLKQLTDAIRLTVVDRISDAVIR
jgi:hypothetical protein